MFLMHLKVIYGYITYVIYKYMYIYTYMYIYYIQNIYVCYGAEFLLLKPG